MRDVGICIAVAASVAALVISLAHRNHVARSVLDSGTSSRDAQQHDEPGGFA